MSRSSSLVSAVVCRKLKAIGKSRYDPVGIALAQEVARNVTEVVLYDVLVHPAGAATDDEKVLRPLDIRNRTS
jgi:hypothetical protein